MTRLKTFAFACLCFAAFASAAFGQSTADQIGLTALRDRLGAATPTGAGVPIMQAEAVENPPPNPPFN